MENGDGFVASQIVTRRQSNSRQNRGSEAPATIRRKREHRSMDTAPSYEVGSMDIYM